MVTRRFTDKVVWITGASSGIGRALAMKFAEHGAMVAVSARRVDRLRDVVLAIEQEGGRAVAVPCDVRDEGSQREAVERVVERYGRVDVAVANAGLAVEGRIADLTLEDWRRQLETNVVGVALSARFAIPELERTRGRLAVVASVAAFVPHPGAAAYTASKAAASAIGQALSIECREAGVSCTTIHPGYVDSELAFLDPQGVYNPALPDRRPAGLAWSADRAAGVMVRAIHRRRREFVFTGHGKVAVFFGRHFPGLVHLAMSRGSAAAALPPPGS